MRSALRLIAMAIGKILHRFTRVTYSGRHPTYKEAFEFLLTGPFLIRLDAEAFKAA